MHSSLGVTSDALLRQWLTIHLQACDIVYDRVSIRKVHPSAYHPCSNCGVERVNHVMAQMLSMVGNEKQTDLDVLLPHVSAAYNNYLSTLPPDLTQTRSTSAAYPASRSWFSNPRTSAVTRA